MTPGALKRAMPILLAGPLLAAVLTCEEKLRMLTLRASPATTDAALHAPLHCASMRLLRMVMEECSTRVADKVTAYWVARNVEEVATTCTWERTPADAYTRRHSVHPTSVLFSTATVESTAPVNALRTTKAPPSITMLRRMTANVPLATNSMFALCQ